MNSRRSLWIAVLVTAGILGLLAFRSIEAQGGQGLPERVAVLENKVKTLEATVATLEKALKDTVVKSGDRVALKTRVNLFIGTTDGRGTVNTGTPGKPDRTVAGSDETFEIQRQP